MPPSAAGGATLRHPFPRGTHVEAIKPGGRHIWRPAHVVKLEGDLYHVCFRGELAHYGVAVRNVRARPQKKQPPKAAAATTFVEIVSDDEHPEPGEIVHKQPPKVTPFAPPGSDPPPMPMPAQVPSAPVDPYANIRVKSFVAPFNPPPRPVGDDPYSTSRMRAVLHDPNRTRLPPPWLSRPHRPHHLQLPWGAQGWRERKQHYRGRDAAPALAERLPPPTHTHKLTRTPTPTPTHTLTRTPPPKERAVARDTKLQAKVAREQRRLGVDDALANFAIPRKPPPPWVPQHPHPHMSLGTGAQHAAAAVTDTDDSSSTPLTDTTPSSEASTRRRLSTSSDDSDDVDDDVDERVVRRRRRTRGAPRKRRRTSAGAGSSPSRGLVKDLIRTPTPPPPPPPPPDTRGNGRRKQTPKRHAGAGRLAVLRAVDDELAEAAAALQLTGTAEACSACGKVHASAPGGAWVCGVCGRAGCALDRPPRGSGTGSATRVCAACTDALASGLARLRVSLPAGTSWSVPTPADPLVVELRSKPRRRVASNSLFTSRRRYQRREPLTKEEVRQMQQNIDDLRAGVLPDSTHAR